MSSEITKIRLPRRPSGPKMGGMSLTPKQKAQRKIAARASATARSRRGKKNFKAAQHAADSTMASGPKPGYRVGMGPASPRQRQRIHAVNARNAAKMRMARGDKTAGRSYERNRQNVDNAVRSRKAMKAAAGRGRRRKPRSVAELSASVSREAVARRRAVGVEKAEVSKLPKPRRPRPNLPGGKRKLTPKEHAQRVAAAKASAAKRRGKGKRKPPSVTSGGSVRRSGFKVRIGTVDHSVEPLDEKKFQKYVKPKLRPGYASSLAEYQKKHPEVTHIDIQSDDRGVRGGETGALNEFDWLKSRAAQVPAPKKKAAAKKKASAKKKPAARTPTGRTTKRSAAYKKRVAEWDEQDAQSAARVYEKYGWMDIDAEIRRLKEARPRIVAERKASRGGSDYGDRPTGASIDRELRILRRAKKILQEKEASKRG